MSKLTSSQAAYLAKVSANISKASSAARGTDTNTSYTTGELKVIMAGHKYDVGPYDCACQIVDNRMDAKDAQSFSQTTPSNQ